MLSAIFAQLAEALAIWQTSEMLFRKTRATSPTLKERVEEFWKWYGEHAERFHETIQARRCSDLTSEVSEAVIRWLPGMAWVFGPGEKDHEESFTLSGEASLPEQFVAEYWLSKAPKLKNWVFYASRQPSKEREKFTLKLEGQHAFRAEEFWLAPYVDKEAENIDIKVWHPSLHCLDEKKRFTALFLIMDELLGEHGTQAWIGDIKFSEEHLKTSIPITELPELIHDMQKEHGWKKYAPTETYSSYELKKQDSPWLRSDTVAGTTRHFALLRDFFDTKGPCDHPIPKLGVDYIFISIKTSYFPKGAEVTGRGEIEDDIIAALQPAGLGISLGGATGSDNCYLDFALYDGARSLKLVKDVLARHKLPKDTKIRFFTSDRAKEVISI